MANNVGLENCRNATSQRRHCYCAPAFLEYWHDEFQTGIALDLGDGPRMHFIQRVLLLADAEGLRALSGTKGASGTKPCLKCSNVLSHAAAEAGTPDNHTSLAEKSHAALKLLTQRRLDAILQYIQSLRTKKAMTEAETLLGWNLEATLPGCLASDKLRTWLNLSHCHFDSMHIYFTNGMLGQELGYWWTAIQTKTNVTIEDVQSYVCAGWKISTARGGFTLAQLRACFSDKLLKKMRTTEGTLIKPWLCSHCWCNSEKKFYVEKLKA